MRNVEFDGDVIVDVGVDGEGDVAVDETGCALVAAVLDDLSMLKVVDARIRQRGGEILERMVAMLRSSWVKRPRPRRRRCQPQRQRRRPRQPRRQLRSE
jgi:hypothetical protein